jgi:hypothetical protein
MSNEEKFIQDYTKNCSNELCAVEDRFGKKVISYHEWLTPDDTRKAVEIAREETIKEVCEWLDNHLIDYWSQSVTDGSGFIEDLKKHFESLEP